MYTYKPVDYFGVDDLLTDEHKIIRGSIRDWVNRSVIPIIEEAAQKHEFPQHLFKELGEIGAFGPFIPEKLISQGKPLCHKGISESKFTDSKPEDRDMIREFILWLESLGEVGFSGHPYDWKDTQ